MDKIYISTDEISNYSEAVQLFLQQGLSLDDAYFALLSSYWRMTVPNKELLAEYVIRAKGPERSLRQFAEEIDVNVSTLSRIVNKKTSAANSDRIFSKIAAHADKNCGITFEMFMNALGLVNEEAEINERVRTDVKEAVVKKILDELLRRKYTVTMMEYDPIDTLAGKFVFDLAVETDAWGSNGCWGFIVESSLCTTIKQTDEEFEKNVMRMMRKISYLSSLYDTFGFTFDRVTAVFVDEDLFYAVKDRYEKMYGLYLNHEVTLLLIDKETELIMEHFIIQWMKPDEEPERQPVFTEVPEDEAELDMINNAWNSKYDD